MDRQADRDAEPLLREALDILQQKLPETRWQVVSAQSQLANCLSRQDRFDEAEPLLLDSYTALRDERGLENDSTQVAVGRLVRLYEDWGRPEEAERYRSLVSKPMP